MEYVHILKVSATKLSTKSILLTICTYNYVDNALLSLNSSVGFANFFVELHRQTRGHHPGVFLPVPPRAAVVTKHEEKLIYILQHRQAAPPLPKTQE